MSSKPAKEQTDIVALCASYNFEGRANLHPENVSRALRERVGHAVLEGTVQTMFATNPEQRLTRKQLDQLMQRVHGERGRVLFEHCWLALRIPEPDKPFIDGEDQWARIEKTKRFLEESLADEKVWAEYSRYVKAVVDTDWHEIIQRGTDVEKEWCIRVHVKFLSPVEEEQVLGALRLTCLQLCKEGSASADEFTALYHGTAPESFRRRFAERFVAELGLRDRYRNDAKEWTDTVDYFTRAFAVRAFWEGDRPDAVTSHDSQLPQ